MVYSRKTFIKREAVLNAPLSRGRRSVITCVMHDMYVWHSPNAPLQMFQFVRQVGWERATHNYLHNIGLVKNALELQPADSETAGDTLHRNQSLLFLTAYTCTHYYVLGHYYK
ncbi:hypothetical protein B5X24_HaOG202205 [Helicoverpa armigera]|uniref:Uncharacterized protein n=1 Tax=Helicoverpa armigera TaxID=29058 RepID=A0A2W1BTI0_HELAM|nr:hypothetical protein B5X24_HaOG202205 [Helicoverpa armigera]